jgi:hypothetical protein
MKTLFAVVLLVVSAAALAGGDANKKGSPGDTWLGDANTDDKQRALIVKCPEGTTADAVEALPDQDGVVMVVECNYTQ